MTCRCFRDVIIKKLKLKIFDNNILNALWGLDAQINNPYRHNHKLLQHAITSNIADIK